MADKKITDMTALAAGSQATGDLITVVDVSEAAAADKNKKMTMENLFKGIPSNVGVGTSSPDSSIHISSAGHNAKLRFENRLTTIPATSTFGKIEFESNDASANSSGVLAEIDCFAPRDLNASTDNGAAIAFSTKKIGASESMTRRMVVDTSGKIGIGTEDPNCELHVGNASANPSIEISRGAAGDEHGYRLFGADGAGNVALKFLPVDNGAVGSETIRIDGSGRLLVGASTAPFDTAGGLIQLAHSAGAQTVIGRDDTDIDDDDLIGRVGFTGKHNSSFKDSAAIEAAADADHAGNNRPGRLTFHTTGATGNVTERVRIGSAGQIGLGGANYGTSGQVLTSNGPSAAPTWQAGAGSISPLTADLDVGDFDIISSSNKNIDLSANGTGLIRVTENSLSQVPIVTQHDIGTASNEIPLNQHLGTAAFQDTTSFSVGDLQITAAYTVSTLPSSPSVGRVARVTDASSPSVGSNVSGGGSAAALCWYNGSNWKVIGN